MYIHSQWNLLSKDLFILWVPDSDSASNSDYKPNGNIVICRTFHTAQSWIQILIPTAKNRNRDQNWNQILHLCTYISHKAKINSIQKLLLMEPYNVLWLGKNCSKCGHKKTGSLTNEWYSNSESVVSCCL